MAQGDTDGKGPKEQAADTRTDLAEDRNIMAMERTFAGWLRTAFAAIGIGLGFRAVFGDMQPVWLPKAIATMFILAGAWLAWNAQHRTSHTLERLDAHKFDAIARPNFRLLAYAVILGALVLAGGIWTLE
jgi:putative membrane protein